MPPKCASLVLAEPLIPHNKLLTRQQSLSLTHPRLPVHFKVENPAFYGTLEFAWGPCFRANSSGVFHPSALWGRSSL